jgi:hypothetical protein
LEYVKDGTAYAIEFPWQLTKRELNEAVQLFVQQLLI